MEQIKPGTRCECRDVECPAPGWDPLKSRHSVVVTGGGCIRDAVRMVTVHFERDHKGRTPYINAKMCEACAAYHESKVAR